MLLRLVVGEEQAEQDEDEDVGPGPGGGGPYGLGHSGVLEKAQTSHDQVVGVDQHPVDGEQGHMGEHHQVEPLEGDEVGDGPRVAVAGWVDGGEGATGHLQLGFWLI